MVRSSLAPKWSKTVPFCGMDHQKSNFLLISGSLSFGGCWGQPMVLFWKLVDETQISPPPEATRHHSLTKSWILLPLRAIYLRPFQCDTPCRQLVCLAGITWWQNLPFLHIRAVYLTPYWTTVNTPKTLLYLPVLGPVRQYIAAMYCRTGIHTGTYNRNFGVCIPSESNISLEKMYSWCTYKKNHEGFEE